MPTVNSNAPTTATASAAPSTASVAASVPASYVVRAGDTVSGIAARYGISTASVLALNGLGWKSLIFPGQNGAPDDSHRATGFEPARPWRP